MRQTIIRTNAGPIYWRIYAALGGDEIMCMGELQAKMVEKLHCKGMI